MGNFKEDIVRTEAFVFDVDGVMTDGGIIPTLDGDFIRRYNACLLYTSWPLPLRRSPWRG